MKVTIQFEAQLRHLAGSPDRQIVVDDGTSVQDVVRESVSDTPALAEAVLDAEGRPARSVLVFVNDVPVADFAAVLNQGDVVLLLPPISGG